MTDLEIVAQVAAAHGIESLPATHLEFYKALIAAGRAGAAPVVSPRRERLSADLELGRQAHPEVDFDKGVKIGPSRSIHKIVGFNRNAPKHAFIVEGPQGGRYKCPLSTILAGQR